MTDRILTGFRFVETRDGDTLQAIAARELGDASKWPDLVTINGLAHPYLTGDSELAGPTVRLYGQQIVVPAAFAQASSDAEPDTVFGVDLLLDRGQLSAEDGDLALVSGRANLRQALGHRIATPLRELLFHQLYGCNVHLVKGAGAGPTTGRLGARYVQDAVLSDDRISSASSVTAVVSGDSIAIAAVVQPISGTPLNLSAAV